MRTALALLLLAFAPALAQPVLVAETRDGGMSLRLYSDQPEYRIGDLMTLSVLSDRSGYLLLYYVDSAGQARLVVPSAYSTHHRLYPGQSLQVRDNLGRLLQQRGPRGTECMQAIVTREPLDLERFSQFLEPGSEAPVIKDPQGFTRAVGDELSRRLSERTDPKAPAFGVAVLEYRVEP